MTPVNYKRDIQYLACGLVMLEISENNGTEEISLVTPPLDHPANQNLKNVAGLMLSRMNIIDIVKRYLHKDICIYICFKINNKMMLMFIWKIPIIFKIGSGMSTM